MPERKKISDTCLLNRLVDGEMKAYEEIFVRYYPTPVSYTHLAREAVDHIGVARQEYFVRYVLHVVGYGALLPFDAQRRHHDRFDLLVVLFERDGERRAVVHGDALRLVADE